jgi:phospholipid/cholesterol/gamma-HCH transport system substrate-binding protein
VLLAGAVLAAVLVFTGGDDKYVVNARFKDAGGILKNYGVKIDGITAGKVTKISLLPDDTVNVQMKMDKEAAPIGQNASAKVRPVNLLGEKYVDLEPGDISKPEPSGAVIPASRTAVPVEVDDVLNVLDPDTRTALRLLINESGLALAGRGTDFNRTLTDLPPALDEAKKVVSQVAAENKNLETAITQGNKVIHSMASRGDDLGDLVDSAAKALQTTADRRAQLGDTVRTAPAALSRLRTTLGDLRSATDDLAPAADDLRTATPSLASTLTRLPQFADDATQTLDEVRSVSPTLNKLGTQSTPTLKRLRPTAARLAQFAQDSDTLIGGLGNGGGLRAVLQFADDWAHVTDNQDGLSHVFRLRLSVNPDLITSALAKYSKTYLGGAAPKRKASTPAAAAAPSAAPAPAPAPETKKPGLLPKLLPVPIAEAIQQGVDDIGKTVTGVLGAVTGGKKGGGDPQGSDDATKLLNYLLAP